MVDVLIFRRWLYAHLLTTGIVLLAWLPPVYAQSLTDIRIGEYDNFTRIVFESNATFEAEKIVSSDPGKLTVIFRKTNPAFIRKIPVDRDPHIDRIKVFTHDDKLSITLFFSNPHARFDTFGLKAPPRMVLDVFWQPPQQQPVSGSSPNKSVVMPMEKELPQGRPSPSTGPATGSLTGMHDRPSLDSYSDRKTSPFEEESIKTTKNDSAVSKPSAAITPDNEVQNTVSRRFSTATGSPLDSPVDAGGETTSRSLLYYLVIALVIITIGILLLLAIMLMLRRHWGEEKRSLKNNEYLRHQDKRIASINERVQEQLKRYDEV